MLDELFMQIIDMSKIAGLVILIVILARLLLRKAPKVISYALWAVVLFRLLCPLSIEAPISFIPDVTPVSQNYSLADEPISVAGAGLAAYRAVGDALNGGLGIQIIPTTERNENGNIRYVSTDWWDVWILFGQYVWLAGIIAMLLYCVVYYSKIHKKLKVVVPLRENIYIADDIRSPFVIGFIRPKIYLPFGLNGKEQEYIILHEQHHIKRLDHVFKALAFLALSIHWFNPLVWLAFVLASKDMEMSCDEAIVRKMGEGVRADYSASLLALATGHRIIAGTPLAFGEGNTKQRIKNLGKWKKPVLWVVVLAVVACILLAVCLLTNPSGSREFAMTGHNISDLNPQQILTEISEAERLNDSSLLCVNSDNFDLMLTSNFDLANSGAIRFFYMKNQKTYSAQLRLFIENDKYFVTKRSEWIEQNRIFKLHNYLEALKYMPQEQIRQLSLDADGYSIALADYGGLNDFERVISYSADGVKEINGWYIHLAVQPLHEVNGSYNGSGDELIHLFYGHEDLVMLED